MSSPPPIITVPERPFPTASPTADTASQKNLVIGAYAECYLFGAVVANLFDWEVKPVFDYANLTAHGDYWQVNAFLDAGWTGRARGYLTLLAHTHLNSALSSKIPTALTFVGYTTMGNATGGSNPFIVWQGSCFIKDLSLLAPMAMFEQEINLIGSGVPTTIG